MASTASPLTVLIPTHGRPTLLGRTLASLAGCRLPEGYRETVVVENGARAGAEAVVDEAAQAHPHLRLRYLHVAWANKSHALNEALQTVEGGLVVFFDDDVRVAAGVLEAYAEAARLHPNGGAFYGGPVRIDYELHPPAWLIPHLPHSARGYELSDRGTMSDEYLGFNWAAFVSDIMEAGGFDPQYGPGSPTGARGQESDMQQRMRARGVGPYDVPAAIVWHYVPRERSTLRWMLGRCYQQGISRNLRNGRGFGFVGLQLVRSLASLSKQVVVGGRKDALSALCGLAANVGALRACFSTQSSSEALPSPRPTSTTIGPKA